MRQAFRPKIMVFKHEKILLTGRPGCGKTTAVIKILDSLNLKNVAGFYTQEIRENNIRKGFRWTRLDASTGILAHTEIKSQFKVGKYGVDVVSFEKSVVPCIDTDKTNAELFVIDEIGKMECFSNKFITSVRRLFASDKTVLATVAQKGADLISEVKKYPGIKLFVLTSKSRDKTISQALKILSGDNNSN